MQAVLDLERPAEACPDVARSQSAGTWAAAHDDERKARPGEERSPDRPDAFTPARGDPGHDDVGIDEFGRELIPRLRAGAQELDRSHAA